MLWFALGILILLSYRFYTKSDLAYQQWHVSGAEVQYMLGQHGFYPSGSGNDLNVGICMLDPLLFSSVPLDSIHIEYIYLRYVSNEVICVSKR